MTRVLICSTDLLFGAGLRALIDAQPDLEVVAQVQGDHESLRATEELLPDIVLISGLVVSLDIQRKIARTAKVIMLTDVGAVRASDFFSVNARAVLSPSSSPTELIHSIHVVASGDTVLMPLAIAEKTVRQVRSTVTGGRSDPQDILTGRQLDVLVLLTQGLSNAEVAAELCVTETTVRSHVHQILNRLAVRSRAQAVATAYESGLIAI